MIARPFSTEPHANRTQPLASPSARGSEPPSGERFFLQVPGQSTHSEAELTQWWIHSELRQLGALIDMLLAQSVGLSQARLDMTLALAVVDYQAARISAFVDFGKVYAGADDFDPGELRASTGVELLWRAPVGPISISYAFPIKTEDADKVERLQFTFGGAL